jgi:hypothetical protein
MRIFCLEEKSFGIYLCGGVVASTSSLPLILPCCYSRHQNHTNNNPAEKEGEGKIFITLSLVSVLLYSGREMMEKLTVTASATTKRREREKVEVLFLYVRRRRRKKMR